MGPGRDGWGRGACARESGGGRECAGVRLVGAGATTCMMGVPRACCVGHGGAAEALAT